MATDYSDVTEIPGSGATKEQLQRLYQRYYTAGERCSGKRVLEVACGASIGLGYLAQSARFVVGGDYTLPLLQLANEHYRQRIPLLRLDAHRLPFADKTFDVAILFEAIYYLQDAKQFIEEAYRVLDADGLLIISTVNKDWDEFAPSPFSHRYHSVPELKELVQQAGFDMTDFFGGFAVERKSLKNKMISSVRKIIIACNLMPKTLEGRAKFKKIFYGKLNPIPAQMEQDLTSLEPVTALESSLVNNAFKIIYCFGKKKRSV